jgi:hypothetical protein
MATAIASIGQVFKTVDWFVPPYMGMSPTLFVCRMSSAPVRTRHGNQCHERWDHWGVDR